MKVIHNKHDKFFKAAMAALRVSKDFLQRHLPSALKALVDFESLAMQPTSYVDQALKHVMSDVLYRAKLKTGEAVLIFILIEHQSTCDPLMPMRIWQYIIAIWHDFIEQHKSDKKSKPKQLPLTTIGFLYRHRALQWLH